MPAGIVLAGRRAGLAWHGRTLLRRVAALVARAAPPARSSSCAPPARMCLSSPGGVRVVEGTRGPLGGLLAGPQAVDAGVAFVAPSRDPLEPLAEGDEVAFMAADVAG